MLYAFYAAGVQAITAVESGKQAMRTYVLDIVQMPSKLLQVFFRYWRVKITGNELPHS